MTTGFRIVPAGDASLLVQFEERIDPSIHARIVGAASAVRAAALPGVLDVAPAYRSLGIYFDPTQTDLGRLLPLVSGIVSSARPAAVSKGAPIPVPVCYGGAYGPDLAHVAAFAGMDEAAVVALHTSATYRVYMLGFAPGFAYMGTLDARIAAPRLSVPRPRVPAGAVGIAGAQTGIYPFATPGGWQIIGRTSVRPCDVTRADPFLFAPGDRVRFHAVSADALEQALALSARSAM